MAYDDIVLGTAANSKIIEIKLRDSTTGLGKTGLVHDSAGAKCYYIREVSLAAPAAITLGHGTASSAYNSGDFVELDATNMPGVYQLHIPNAALATGANACTIHLGFTGVIDVSKRILIMGSDLRAAALAANTTQFAGQAITCAAPTTVPTLIASTTNITAGTIATVTNVTNAVTISTGSGAGQLDISGGVVKSDLVSIVGTLLTETAGYLAAGFKKFFNIATPVLTVTSVNQTIDNPTAAAIGTDAASKVLATPAQKIVTDGSGFVSCPATQHVIVDSGTVTTVTTATNVTTISNGAITAGSFGAGAIDAAAIKDAAIDFATFAADCKTGTGLKANVESVSANAIDAAAIKDAAIDAATFAAGAINAAAIADAAIDNATFAADVGTTAIAGNNIGLACDKSIIKQIATDTMTAIAVAAPPSVPTIEEMIRYLYFFWRNKTTSTDAVVSMFQDDALTVACKANIADAAGTFTKDEYISG